MTYDQASIKAQREVEQMMRDEGRYMPLTGEYEWTHADYGMLADLTERYMRGDIFEEPATADFGYQVECAGQFHR